MHDVTGYRITRESLRSIDPQQVNGHHEDQGMDRSGYQRGLAGCEDPLRARRKGQKNTRTENEEQNGDQQMIHRNYLVNRFLAYPVQTNQARITFVLRVAMGTNRPSPSYDLACTVDTNPCRTGLGRAAGREPFGRVDHVDPQQMDRHHEDQGVDRGGYQRGLTRCEDSLGTRWKCQKNTRAENKEQHGDQQMVHFLR